MAREDRANKKLVGGWVTVEKWKKFRHLVTDRQSTTSDLIAEAVDLLGEKYSEQPQEPGRKKTSRRSHSADC
jgi:hypothetical protein